ncbi:MAG: A/G-specific adenine glycosylase [Pseudomonadales bacterium]
MNWLARNLLNWFDQHGRKHLPWQQQITPYRVWVSEIMLQQTQVATVIDYYQRFMTRFPGVHELAAAELDEVLHHWTGLGYYARGRNLHKAAQHIVSAHNGDFPVGVAALCELPGIGPSTAGAIAAISQGQRAPILDANVKRVLARFHAVSGYPGVSAVGKRLWYFADYHTPARRTADYTQAIMDLGASLCSAKQPQCSQCPLQERCEARILGLAENYPARKPRKEKPVRSARMWLLVDSNDAVLLARRPPTGIWGSLWTPLETSADADLASALQQVSERAGLSLESLSQPILLTPFRHTFTHYHLDIEPLLVRVRGNSRATAVSEVDDLLWYLPDQANNIGLAKPTVTLLSVLRQGQLLE